jgi:hypothetical protein
MSSVAAHPVPGRAPFRPRPGRRSRWLILGLAATVLAGATARAHGGADGWEHDRCAVERGDHVLHFSAYQYAGEGTASGRETVNGLPGQFCDSLPRAGKATIVIDLVDTALRGVPVSMQVREEPGARTILDLPAQTYRAGVMRADTVFEKNGRYSILIGFSGETVAFPLNVGAGIGVLGSWEPAAWALSFLAIGSGYWIQRRYRTRRKAAGGR